MVFDEQFIERRCLLIAGALRPRLCVVALNKFLKDENTWLVKIRSVLGVERVDSAKEAGKSEVSP